MSHASSVHVVVQSEDPSRQDSRALFDEANALLSVFTGDGDQGRWTPSDVRASDGFFLVARTIYGTPLGFGAFVHFNA
jgi:hypothetical protein